MTAPDGTARPRAGAIARHVPQWPAGMRLVKFTLAVVAAVLIAIGIAAYYGGDDVELPFAYEGFD